MKEKARQHIEGDITIDEVKQLVDSYYKSKVARSSSEDRTEEADKVSARITEILSENTFTFSPIEYLAIHRHLFEGIFSHAGQIRDYNITKNEWVLKGATVLYASAGSIRETLEYDFSQEKIFDYKNLNIDEAIRHIARFVSGIWQIHAFGEGNTPQQPYSRSNICILLDSISVTRPSPTILGTSAMLSSELTIMT